MRLRRLVAVALAAALVSLSLPASAASDTVVVDGLAGPLGLAVGNNGSVLVTEAFGTGRLLVIDKDGSQSVLVEEPGTELAGVDVTGDGNIVFTQTTFGPTIEATLERITKNGSIVEIASTQAYEESNNPDGSHSYGFLEGANDACLEQFGAVVGAPPLYQGIIESHPYAVATVGGRHFVADAAGNTLLMISANGTTRTLAVFPAVAQTIDQQTADGFGIPDCAGETYWGEPVPTDVEVGPDGALYVSLLPGAPELPGSGQIWKVNRRTGAMRLVADGLSSPVDIAVGKDGTIYVAELFANQISTVSGGRVDFYMAISTPGAIEIANDGTLYATKDVFGNGAVVKLGG